MVGCIISTIIFNIVSIINIIIIGNLREGCKYFWNDVFTVW